MSKVGRTPHLPANPIVNLLTNVIRRKAIAFLDLKLEPIAPSIYDLEIIIRQPGPLLLNPKFSPFPGSSEAVPIHRSPPVKSLKRLKRPGVSKAEK
jgi:hypothetical protein